MIDYLVWGWDFEHFMDEVNNFIPFLACELLSNLDHHVLNSLDAEFG